MADGENENSWNQYYLLSRLGGGGGGENARGVSHKHWEPHKIGDRRN